MKYKTQLRVFCKSKAEKTAMIGILYGLGYTYLDIPTLKQCLIQQEKDINNLTQYPYVLLNGDDVNKDNFIDMCGSTFRGDPDVTDYKFSELTKIMDYLTDDFTPVKIKLNKSYDALVMSDGIQVGCQLIPYDAFDELVKAVNKSRIRPKKM